MASIRINPDLAFTGHVDVSFHQPYLGASRAYRVRCHFDAGESTRVLTMSLSNGMPMLMTICHRYGNPACAYGIYAIYSSAASDRTCSVAPLVGPIKIAGSTLVNWTVTTNYNEETGNSELTITRNNTSSQSWFYITLFPQTV